MFALLAAAAALVTAISGPAQHAVHAPHAADRVAVSASADQPVKADATTWHWACDLPMVLTPAAGPGVTPADITAALAHPVEVLQGLGYDVTVGDPAPYRRDAVASEQIGEVLVVATNSRAQQRELGDKAARALTNTSGRQALAATLVVDANPKYGELSGTVLLHELGHVLGLGHKHGTVMDESWDAPADFDAAELAAIDCR